MHPSTPAVFLAAWATATLSIVRLENLTHVTATTELGGLVYYHWYVDGRLIQTGQANVLAVQLDFGRQARIECLVGNSATPPAEELPDAWPAVRTVRFLRSIDDTVRQYRVDQAKADPGVLADEDLVAKSLKDLAAWGDWDGWTELATVSRDAAAWLYQLATDRLDDLGVYKFRVVPIDDAGNTGTAAETDPIKSIRRPDAPDFAIAFDAGTTKVTFSEA